MERPSVHTAIHGSCSCSRLAKHCPCPLTGICSGSALSSAATCKQAHTRQLSTPTCVLLLVTVGSMSLPDKVRSNRKTPYMEKFSWNLQFNPMLATVPGVEQGWGAPSLLFQFLGLCMFVLGFLSLSSPFSLLVSLSNNSPSMKLSSIRLQRGYKYPSLLGYKFLSFICLTFL